MGGSTQQTQQTQQKTEPWAPAIPLATNLLGQLQGRLDNTGVTANETSALDALTANAQVGNPYAPAIGGVANSLLAGGNATAQAPMLQSAYQQYANQLSPYASGAMLDPSKNPALQNYLSTIQNDVANQVNAQFAGAGRDLSGLNQQALARGISQGEAPVLLDAYNQAVQNQLGAAGSLYGAANSTGGLLSNLNQTQLQNQQAGIGASSAALQARDASANQLLALEAMRRGLPLQNIGQIENLMVPLAQLGGSSNGTSTTTVQQDPTRAIIGAGIAGLGLLSGNPMLMAQGGGGILGGLGGGNPFANTTLGGGPGLFNGTFGWG
jgi:hypothetical protein